MYAYLWKCFTPLECLHSTARYQSTGDIFEKCACLKLVDALSLIMQRVARKPGAGCFFVALTYLLAPMWRVRADANILYVVYRIAVLHRYQYLLPAAPCRSYALAPSSRKTPPTPFAFFVFCAAMSTLASAPRRYFPGRFPTPVVPSTWIFHAVYGQSRPSPLSKTFWVCGGVLGTRLLLDSKCTSHPLRNIFCKRSRLSHLPARPPYLHRCSSDQQNT